MTHPTRGRLVARPSDAADDGRDRCDDAVDDRRDRLEDAVEEAAAFDGDWGGEDGGGQRGEEEEGGVHFGNWVGDKFVEGESWLADLENHRFWEEERREEGG